MATAANPFDAVLAQVQGGQQQQPAPNSQQTLQPSPPPQASGNPFDAVIAQSAKAQTNGQQPSHPIGDFFSGIYQNTLGPIVTLGKELAQYEAQKKQAQQALDAAGGPLVMLADAVSDPNHPLHKLGAGVVQSAWQQAQDAYKYAGDAGTASAMALHALAQGNLSEAGEHASNALSAGVQAAGHKWAAELPGVGAAAAQAGEDMTTDGQGAKGAGEAVGLIGSVLAPGAIAKGVGVAGDAIDGVKAIPSKFDTATPAEALRSNITDAGTNVAGEHELIPTASDSVRDSLSNAGDAIFAKSKGLYRAVDDATNGRWQLNENALKAVGRKIRTATEDEDLSEAFGHQQELFEQQDAILKEAEDAGVDPDTIAQAKATWRQASALNDVQSAVNISTAGRAGVTAGEAVDANKLLPRLVKLYDAGRLQEAMGSDENAIRFIQATENAGNDLAAAKALPGRIWRFGKGTAIALGAGGGLLEGAKLLGALGGDHAK